MGRYYHDSVNYESGIESGRVEAGSRVKGGSEAARKRMLNRDVMYKKKVERELAAREWEKLQKEEQKERERLDRWAKGTGFYKDYSDYLEHRREGRQGYAD